MISRCNINEIRLLTKLSEKFAPIKIEQTTLYKFCSDLPEPKTRDLLVQLNKKEAISNDNYTLSIEAGNTIEIQEAHCFECGTRLKKNGFNDRVAILDEGFGRHEFRIHRKYCRKCVEIKPDYSKLAPKYGNYHENYKRRVRQHYMEGLMPSQIKRVLKIDFGIEFSKSSIINWINEAAEPLREMLEKTPVLIDSTEWNLPHKIIWMKLKSYLVKKEDFSKIYSCLKEKNFMGNWMPSLDAPSNVFLDEYYWGIPFIEKYIDWFGRFDWTFFMDNLQIKILPTTDYYVRGSSWRDYSIEGLRLRILLVHRWIKEKMNLCWNLVRKGFYDEEGTLIAFDVSYLYDKPDVFLINKEKCIEFLEKEGLSLFWIAYSNKHIVGDYFEDKNIRYDINGFFLLKNKKIEGKLGVIDVWYPSIIKKIKDYESKTGKKALWRGKITKKFKQWYYNKIEK